MNNNKIYTYIENTRIFLKQYCVGCETKQLIFSKLKLQFLSYKLSQSIGLEV